MNWFPLAKRKAAYYFLILMNQQKTYVRSVENLLGCQN